MDKQILLKYADEILRGLQAGEFDKNMAVIESVLIRFSREIALKTVVPVPAKECGSVQHLNDNKKPLEICDIRNITLIDNGIISRPLIGDSAVYYPTLKDLFHSMAEQPCEEYKDLRHHTMKYDAFEIVLKIKNQNI